MSSIKLGDRVVSLCEIPEHHGRVGVVTNINPFVQPPVLLIAFDGGDECAVGANGARLDARAAALAPPERSAILKDADALITGPRQEEYGSPSVNFQRIADMWVILFPEREWTPGDVARAMAAVKLARSAQSFSRDTAVDLAGYAAIYGELEAER